MIVSDDSTLRLIAFQTQITFCILYAGVLPPYIICLPAKMILQLLGASCISGYISKVEELIESNMTMSDLNVSDPTMSDPIVTDPFMSDNSSQNMVVFPDMVFADIHSASQLQQDMKFSLSE